MDSQKLSALLSSLISQLFLLLLLLFPDSESCERTNLFPLISHFVSSQQIAASLYFLSISRKRKRTHLPEQDSEPTHEDKVSKLGPGLGQLGLPRSPDSFKNSFKMSSTTFRWLSGLLEPLLDCRDPVGLPLNLSADLRLGIGLFRLVTGSTYHEIATRFAVTESAARFCVKQLCRVLCTNFRFWVAFPGTEELESISKSFEELTGLPNCCGVIDCTRFKLVKIEGSKSSRDERVSEDSIAVQIVVDSSSRILSIVAGIRGDKGDSRVLKSSTLYKDIEAKKLLNSGQISVNGVVIDQYLIGDGGYPLLPWLMVPFVDAKPGTSEENFNAAHNLMRMPALKAIASLKNWGVLSRPIQEEFKTAVALIGACSILHNALLMREDDSGLCNDLGDYSLHDESSQYYSDASLEDNSIEKKASAVRSALSTRARVCHDSSHSKDPSSSVQ
ncbi:Harbinger transposase-derived nuclease [Melia azedarach]|uniref:Harbinger transposase-derived nuclease n=1 Tax=Melia azedarach TaxID=155640 RepID=A0ACC1Y030_MELAZ|nr:Harbinger transposase-derived nuclease [Melia azedarach]